MISDKCELEMWFLSHNSGEVEVQNKRGEVKKFDNYPEAVEFLELKEDIKF